MESQGTLCQCSCFSPHSPGSHGARLLDLFVSLSHKAWNELKCPLISSAKSPGGTEATDHECAEGKADSGPEQPHSLGRLLQEWPMGPGAEQSQGDSDLLETPGSSLRGRGKAGLHFWKGGGEEGHGCPLTARWGGGCHSPRPGAAVVPGNEHKPGGWRAQVGAHLGGGTWDWQAGRETNASRALPATEEPVLISPLAWVHDLQPTAAEVQKG